MSGPAISLMEGFSFSFMEQSSLEGFFPPGIICCAPAALPVHLFCAAFETTKYYPVQSNDHVLRRLLAAASVLCCAVLCCAASAAAAAFAMCSCPCHGKSERKGRKKQKQNNGLH
jgi:hypothetical protein